MIDVRFSPDGGTLASASFDKSIRLWDGRTGKFIAALRGHVQASVIVGRLVANVQVLTLFLPLQKVYQLAWSADSRLLVSGSADSTLKVCDNGDILTHKKTDRTFFLFSPALVFPPAQPLGRPPRARGRSVRGGLGAGRTGQD